MENYKLRVKIGQYEFEAEGAEESVKAQFLEFKEMIGSITSRQNTTTPMPAPAWGATASPSASPSPSPSLEIMEHGRGMDRLEIAEHIKGIDRLFNVDEKRNVIALRIHPVGAEKYRDAMLLILFAYKLLKNNAEVSVIDIKRSLQQSGLLGSNRVDRIADAYRKKQFILKGGTGKGGKYSLTITGENKARDIVGSLLGQIG